LVALVSVILAEIFNQLKELEKRFNEIKYPPEAAFQPSFSLKIQKTEQESLLHSLSVFELDELFEKVEE
jgi:hypothetical protein